MKSLLLAAALAATAALPLIASTAASAAPAAPAAAPAGASEPIKAVYHINEIDKARGLLANVRNHLRDDPAARIVVIANSKGIDFLLADAVDQAGVPFAPVLEELLAKGVQFKVCRNTLTSRNLTDKAVAESVGVVQAGVAEIARLQAREGFVYLKP